MTTPNRAKKAISNAKQTLSTSPLKKSNRYSIPNNNNFMVQIKNIKTPPKGAKPKNNIEYILNTTNHHKMASNFFNILPKNKKSNNIREMNNLYKKLTNNVRNITPIKSKLFLMAQANPKQYAEPNPNFFFLLIKYTLESFS